MKNREHSFLTSLEFNRFAIADERSRFTINGRECVLVDVEILGLSFREAIAGAVVIFVVSISANTLNGRFFSIVFLPRGPPPAA